MSKNKLPSQPAITAEHIVLGAEAQSFFDKDQTAPWWASDSDKWSAARTIALRTHGVTSPKLWSSTVAHYQQEGGRIASKDEEPVAARENSEPIQATGIATTVEDAPDEIMYMPAGVHTIRASKAGKPFQCTVSVDPSTAGVLQASLNKLVLDRHPQRPYFDFDHEGKKASAWPVGFAWKQYPEPGVYAKVNWSESGKKAVLGRDFRSFSPTFFADGGDPAKVTAMDFIGGSLVNAPAFRKISPLWCKEDASTPQIPDPSSNAAASASGTAAAEKPIKTAEPVAQSASVSVGAHGSFDNIRSEVREAIEKDARYKSETVEDHPVNRYWLRDVVVGVDSAPWLAILEERKTSSLTKQEFKWVADNDGDGGPDVEFVGEPKHTDLVYSSENRFLELLKAVNAAEMVDEPAKEKQTDTEKPEGEKKRGPSVIAAGLPHNILSVSDGICALETPLDGCEHVSVARIREMVEAKEATLEGITAEELGTMSGTLVTTEVPKKGDAKPADDKKKCVECGAELTDEDEGAACADCVAEKESASKAEASDPLVRSISAIKNELTRKLAKHPHYDPAKGRFSLSDVLVCKDGGPWRAIIGDSQSNFLLAHEFTVGPAGVVLAKEDAELIDGYDETKSLFGRFVDAKAIPRIET